MSEIACGMIRQKKKSPNANSQPSKSLKDSTLMNENHQGILPSLERVRGTGHMGTSILLYKPMYPERNILYMN